MAFPLTDVSLDREPLVAEPELTILMPCLNEAETLAGCIAEAQGYLRAHEVVGEVLVADNGSTDGSQGIATGLGARVIEVSVRGYGAALASGVQAARGRFVVMGDADASYDFSDLGPFLGGLRDGADLVMGNRFKGGVEPGAMPALHRYLGNPVLSFVGRLLFRSPIKDFHCGLRGFRRDSLLRLDLQTTGMEFASEMVVRATLGGLRVQEVPTRLRRDGRSRPPHLRSWHDGWRHLRFLLLFSPRWLFLYPGMMAVVIGLLGMGLLGSGLWTPGEGRLAEGLMVACGGLVVVGTQATQVAATARDYGASQHLLPPSQNKLHKRLAGISLEATLLVAAALVLSGMVMLVISLLSSNHSDPHAAEATVALRLGVIGVTSGVMGIQLAVGAWLRSLMRLPQRRPASSEPINGSDDRG